MSSIKVLVRPRPIDESKKEKWAPGFEIHGRRITLGTKTYDPDVTVPINSTQADVFEHCLPILDAVKDGNNGTLMVYGQTGTGKTHTMLGGDGEYNGVAFAAIDHLLAHVRSGVAEGKPLALSLSMLEIYNEKITDMLSADQAEVTLQAGLPRSTTRVTLSNLEEAISKVKKGLSFRHVTATQMNERSSRSHVIIMLDLVDEIITGKPEVAHLFMVDLAGSESLKKSQVTGKAAAEAGLINKSLLALKNVILTLSSTPEHGNRPHVPYRDSRLTEMLQDSIGGSARTMLVACISPNGRDVEETRSTLDYATKARSIRNVSNSERDKMSLKIRGLELELQRARNRLSDRVSERNGLWYTKEEHEEVANQKEKLQDVEADVKTLLQDKTDLMAKHSITESHTAIYKDLLKAKETEYQDLKTQVILKERQMQEVLNHCEAQVGNFCSSLEAATARELALIRSNLEEGLKTLRSNQEGKMLDDASHAAIWQRVEKEHRDAIFRLGEQFNSALQHNLETHVELEKRFQEKAAEMVRSFQQDMNSLVGVMASRTRDLETEKKCWPSVNHALVNNISREQDTKHLMQTYSNETFDGVQSMLPPPTVPDSLADVIMKAKSAFRRSGSSIASEQLGLITSSDTDSIPSSAGIPPLGTRSDTNTVQSGAVGQKRARSPWTAETSRVGTGATRRLSRQ